MNESVAYFSMEIGIESEIKTYSGGLGVLAGDTLKSAADQGLDFTGVTLLYRGGYFKQVLDESNYQREQPDWWDYRNILEETGEKIELHIKDELVEAKIWSYTYEGVKGSVTVYFLDTDVEGNSDLAKSYTHQLYDGGDEMRLCQETLLGIGGVRALKALGIEPNFYHMNEGHSALLTLEADGGFAFTTHTPVEAGHDSFNEEVVETVLPEYLDQLDINNGLNMTDLALRNADYQNAVSKKHEEVSEEMFPNHSFDSVTNGVHVDSWVSGQIKSLFDNYIDGWRESSERLSQALKIPDGEIWSAKKEAKEELGEHVAEKTGKSFNPDDFTVGFVRRSTAYKRPKLIFKDLDMLDKLGEKYSGLQLVFGGKAHPADFEGKEIIQEIIEYASMLENVEVFFIENYGIEDSKLILAGCDLWLNNPLRGQEASGTSGMKAALNGTPQLSVLDGWWLEGHIEDVTGWSIGEEYVEGEDQDELDSRSMYRKLDHIVSIYENERVEWLRIMKNCIALNGSYFNTDRMVKEYVSSAYYCE